MKKGPFSILRKFHSSIVLLKAFCIFSVCGTGQPQNTETLSHTPYPRHTTNRQDTDKPKTTATQTKKQRPKTNNTGNNINPSTYILNQQLSDYQHQQQHYPKQPPTNRNQQHQQYIRYIHTTQLPTTDYLRTTNNPTTISNQ